MDYTNDPEPNGKYLGTITKDIAELRPADKFPHTHHVDNVVLLELR